mgnify:CR=1 FL=1
MATLRIQSDGDPHPALAGNNLVGDDEVRVFSDGKLIAEQTYDYTFEYRAGNNTSDPHAVVATSPVGIANNGVLIYSSIASSSTLPATQAIAPAGFNWNMGFTGLSGEFPLDPAGGRPDDSAGEYRYRTGKFHTNGMSTAAFVNSSTYYTNNVFSASAADRLRHDALTVGEIAYTGGHSKILGFAFDGYPIYGPYGYSNSSDPTSTVIRMRSSYDTRTQLETTTSRPSFVDIANGSFVEDYIYRANTGTLDQHNGRFCITPDYKQGTYAYFLTFSDTNLIDPEYPYIIGPSTREQRDNI